MISRSSRRSIVIIASFLISLFISWQAVAAEFLDPEQAYKVSAELGSDGKVVVHWNISKGYKLYRDRISVNVASGNAKLGTPVLPKGIDFVDPSTGDKMEIYHDQLAVTIPVARADGQFTLNVQYQGCADDGLCYPPVDKVFTVDPAKPGALATGTSSGPQSSGMSASLPLSVPTEGNVSTSVSAPAKSVAGGDDMSIAKETLESGSLWKIALAFLVFGLLLSFTPCVLPMLPILSSIIVGEGETGRGKSFMMAVAYCLGLALVYTALGVAAGLAGEGLAGALQKPWVLVLFALLMVALSLSMFDVYHLQIPATLQNRLNSASGKLKGGRFIGVFFMGSISALVVGPCVAAPLAGTLVYISQTKNVLIGGLALFSMATGMSVPLLLIGLSAGSLLPKSGPWMIGVKYVFGLLLIAVAIWMVTPVLPAQALLACWGAFAILSAVFAGIFKPVGEKLSVSMKFSRA
ncbi:MAG: protein-disulfide reductase DsbD, partial [Chlorobiaceae bacterium]|nr:protein-disulfide reductase DsbD [Chlorobiaceae bacterium]